MKTVFFLLFLSSFFVSCTTKSNLLFESSNNDSIPKKDAKPWENLHCEDEQTQTELNICSYKKMLIADSVFNIKYDFIINYIDSSIKAEEKNENKDEYDINSINILKNQKKAILESKENFLKMRENIEIFIADEYNGGSMQSLAVNSYSFGLTVKQIEILENIIDETIDN